MNLDASCLPGVNSRCLIVCQVYNQKIKPKCNGIRLVNVGGISPRPTEVPSRTCHYERARNLLPICYHAFSAPALRRISETNPWSFNDSRLMSTFANAPSIAARARADAVVRSDFMFGFVIGFSLSAISATSRARSATRSEEHTSELQSLTNLVCRLL